MSEQGLLQTSCLHKALMKGKMLIDSSNYAQIQSMKANPDAYKRQEADKGFLKIENCWND